MRSPAPASRRSMPAPSVKARGAAEIVAARLGLPVACDPALGENDRSSTGYIAPPEFWDVVAAFFRSPTESVRGWERAVDAQDRIVGAVFRVARASPPGPVLVVAHGGVGCLLAAHLQGVAIGEEDRPGHPGGGCYIVLDREPLALRGRWHAMEEGLVLPARRDLPGGRPQRLALSTLALETGAAGVMV